MELIRSCRHRGNPAVFQMTTTRWSSCRGKMKDAIVRVPSSAQSRLMTALPNSNPDQSCETPLTSIKARGAAAFYMNGRRFRRFWLRLLGVVSFLLGAGSATRPRPRHDPAAIRNGRGSQRLLHEALEELPRLLAAARVEAERELVQVVSQLGLADGARVRPPQPALQPPGHKIHARHAREGSAVEPLL